MAEDGNMMDRIIARRNQRALLRREKMSEMDPALQPEETNNDPVFKDGIPSEEISPERLAQIRAKTITARKKKQKRFAIFFAITFPLIAYLGYEVFHNFSFGFDTSDAYSSEYREATADPIDDKYVFFLNDGDAWLRKKNYHNAIFQYKKAIEIYPSEYDAHYRLALAYSYQCQYKFEDCEQGMQTLKDLENRLKHSNLSLTNLSAKQQELAQIKTVFVHWGVE